MRPTKIILFALSMLAVMGCSVFGVQVNAEPTQTAVPTPKIACAPCPPTHTPPPADMAAIGLWKLSGDNESGMLSITPRLVYLVERDPVAGTTRESNFKIVEADWQAGLLKLRLSGIRVNGKAAGYDDPAKLMKLTVDGDLLNFGIGSEELGEPAVDGRSWFRQ